MPEFLKKITKKQWQTIGKNAVILVLLFALLLLAGCNDAAFITDPAGESAAGSPSGIESEGKDSANAPSVPEERPTSTPTPSYPELPFAVYNTAAIQIRYEGYIKRELAEAEKHKRLEDKRIPEGIDYKAITGLRLESAEKLDKIRPVSIGQASRISGVNPADIGVLLIYLGNN